MTLVIDRTMLDTLVAHAECDYPTECCGLLVGVRSGPDRIVLRVVPSANIAESDRRRNYQIDGLTLLQTQRKGRGDQMEIVGFYHSHPDGTARPSTSDFVHAWSNVTYLILSVREGRYAGCTAWRFAKEDRPNESNLVVSEE